MSSRAYPSNLPARYERDKLAETRERWDGGLGQRLRAWGPRVMPGVPLEAVMGFASNGADKGDPGLTPAHAAFHELGYFGVEGGPYSLPAPNRDTSEPNSWLRLHNDPRVRAMLGRDATMTPWPVRGVGTSRAEADIPLDDQVAIGLANLADDILGMAREAPAAIRPSNPSSLWAVALGFAAWSAGAGRLRQHLARYADALAAVPEEQRWLALIRLAAADPESAPAGSNHRSPAYTVLRTQQKLRVGRGLARAIGGPVAWFGEIDEAAEDALARRVDGQATDYRLVPPAASGVVVPAVVVLASLAVAGAIVWRRRRGRP